MQEPSKEAKDLARLILDSHDYGPYSVKRIEEIASTLENYVDVRLYQLFLRVFKNLLEKEEWKDC